MLAWEIERTPDYIRHHRWFEKKHPEELSAMLGNLDTYFKTLNLCDNPMQVMGGWLHHEPQGIKAIDQTGHKRKIKLKEARLYIFPHIESRTLFLLTIGDKATQRDDIKLCQRIVNEIKETYNGEKV